MRNIGGENRLDFTDICPAVKLACADRGYAAIWAGRVLLVPSFASMRHHAAVDSLGAFPLKGLSGEQRIYAPLVGYMRSS